MNDIPTSVTEDLIQYKYRLMKRTINSKAWINVPDKNPHIKTYQCDGQDNFKGFMCVAEMNFTIPEIMCYLSKPECMCDYNVPMEFINVFAKANNRRHYAHVGAKGVSFMVSARDFICYSEIANYDPDPQEQSILTFSVEHPDAPAAKKGTVRGTMSVGGWHLVKISDT